MALWIWIKPVIRQTIKSERSRWVLVVLASIAVTSCGFTAPRSNEGYANLDSPGMLDTNRTMALSLGPTVLRFAALFLDEEPEIKALLKSLDGVRIRTYEVYGDTDRIRRNFEHMGEKLGNDGWQSVMLIHDEGELVKMYAKSSGDAVRGLTIVSADEEEIVVVNVMGDIDPVYYSDVMVALDIKEAPSVEIAPLQ